MSDQQKGRPWRRLRGESASDRKVGAGKHRAGDKPNFESQGSDRPSHFLAVPGVLFAAVVLVLYIAVFIGGLQYPLRASILILLASGAGGLLTLLHLAREWWRYHRGQETLGRNRIMDVQKQEGGGKLLVSGIFIVFALLFFLVGFELGSVVGGVLYAWFERGGLKAILGVAVTNAVLMYGVFGYILGVPFPDGWLF